ncbi:MAG: GGDEF domain-containing protein [Treponema sp.]|nr:GGDEF domain-containing protein [Treponema sp.]
MNKGKQRRISDVSFTFDSSLNVTAASRSFLRLFDIVDCKINLGNFMSDFDRDNFIHFLSNFSDKIKTADFIAQLSIYNQQFDSTKHLECMIQVEEKGGEFSGTLQEISSLFNMLDKKIFENRKFSRILSNINSYFFTFDGNRFVMQNTRDLTDLYEGKTETFKHYFVDFFQIDISKKAAIMQVKRLFDDIIEDRLNKSYQYPRTDGTSMSVHTSSYCTREKSETIALISTEVAVISKESFAEKFDGLTNLYNKKTVTEMLENKINVSKQKGSLFIIDVDKFKECNDNFGHAFGDKVLTAVSKVLQDAVNGCGFAGRIGGDEFICFVEKTEEYDVRNIARAIRLGVQWAIPAINPESVVTTSIGIVKIPEQAKTYEEAFKLADKCLYIAKSRGRNCYIIYKPELHNQIIMQNEETVHHVNSGKIYSENADKSLEILTIIKEAKEGFLSKVIPLLLDYMGVHKITIYKYEEGKYVQFYTSGYEDIKFRDDKLNENYFKYFNSYGFLHIDNLNVFDTIDREKFNMYRSDKVTSTLEVCCKNKDGSPKILMCYDVFRPAQTFPPLKIEFGIMAARVIANELKL